MGLFSRHGVYTYSFSCIIMVALWNRAVHGLLYNSTGLHGQCIIFLLCGFFLLSFFSSPNLSSPSWDVYHASTHDVALEQI